MCSVNVSNFLFFQFYIIINKMGHKLYTVYLLFNTWTYSYTLATSAVKSWLWRTGHLVNNTKEISYIEISFVEDRISQWLDLMLEGSVFTIIVWTPLLTNLSKKKLIKLLQHKLNKEVNVRWAVRTSTKIVQIFLIVNGINVFLCKKTMLLENHSKYSNFIIGWKLLQ